MSIEVVKLILQGLTLLTVVVGLVFTIYQLHLLRRSYVDAHDQLHLLRQSYVDAHEWNRRKAAQEAIETVRDLADDTPLLDEKFQIMSRNHPHSLEQVTAECDASGEVRTALHKRLNHFEMMAIGVKQGVLDEQVVKEAYKVMLRRSVNLFCHYIEHRRNTGNPEAWLTFETLSKKWVEEERSSQPRKRTGGATT